MASDLTPYAPGNAAAALPPIARALALAKPMAAPMAAIEKARFAWSQLGGASFARRREHLLEEVDALALEEALAPLRAARDAPYDAKVTYAMLGLMLESLPSAQNFEAKTYRQTVLALIDLEEPVKGVVGYPPAVVSAAVASILKVAKFPPSPGEILEALAHQLRHLLNRIHQAEEILAARQAMIERDRPPTPEQLQEIERQRLEIAARPLSPLQLRIREVEREHAARRREINRKIVAGENPFEHIFDEAGDETVEDPEAAAEGRYR